MQLLNELLIIMEATDADHEVCDEILKYMTKAWRVLSRSDSLEADSKTTIERIYSNWRHDLMVGDLQGWEKSYDQVGAKNVDAFDFFMDEVFAQADLGEKATIEDFYKKVGL